MLPGSSEWSYLGSSTVSGSSWLYSYRPDAKGSYRYQARFAGDGTRDASVSSTVTVRVR